MKIGKWARLALAVLPLLAGCKGFWDAPASTTPTTTTLSSGDFYVLNVATSQIAGYYVNAGVLTALPGSPYTLSSAPIAITVAPNNAFLYVSTISGIFVYTIASTGELTLGNSSQPISTDPANSMQVDRADSWLVEGVSGASTLNAIRVNSSTGDPATAGEAEQTATLSATTFQQVAISPDATYVFAALGTGGTAFISFNSASTANPFGTVATIGVKNSGGSALSVAVDPIPASATAPRLFYVGETVAVTGSDTGGLRVFDFSTLTGTLKEISGSPLAIGGLAPYSILPFSSGDFVYVLNRQTHSGSTGTIAGFSVTESNSAFTLTALGSAFSVGTHPQAMVEDNTHQFVFAVDFDGSPDLEGYTIDSTKAGYLDSVISKSTGTDPVEASAIAAWH